MATISEFINKVGFKVKKDDVKKVNTTIADIKDTASKILGAIGVGISLTAINGLVEEFSLVNQQVRNATSALGEQTDIQQKILAAAKATRSTYQQTASVVSNLVQENSELFGTIDKAIAFNNAATMLFKTAGKTNDEIAGLMEAINKSFAKGYVDSETLSQLLERSPEAVKLLCQELGTTQDQLEQMATDGKFTVDNLYNAFVNNAGTIASAFGNVKMTVTEAITVVRNQWGLWLAETNEMLGLTDAIGKTIITVSDGAVRVLTKVRTGVMWLSEKLGGTQNLLKLVAITAGAIFLAMNFSKIMSGLQAVGKLLTGINLKTLAIVAAITLVALLVDDFINFMKGNNSLLGEMLERAGVDCDALRETIIGAWEAIKSKLAVLWEHMKAAGSAVWEAIKKMAEAIGNGLKAFWAKWGDDITATFGVIWDAVKVIFDSILDILIGVADFIGAVFSGDWEAAWQAIKDIFIAAWEAISAFLEAAWEYIKLLVKIALDFLEGLIKAAWNGIKSVTTSVWNAIKTFFSNVWNGIKTSISNAVNSVKTTISNAWDKVKSTTTAAWDKVKSTITGVWDKIKSGISTAINNVKSTISNVWDSIKSTTSNVWNGIKTAVTNVVDGIKNGVKNGFDTLKSNVTTIWNNIKSAITTPINNAWDTVKGIVEKLKKAFDFKWELPKLKLPHITVTGGVAPFGIGGKGSLPKFNIEWYKEGGILDGAQIFGAMGGKLLGGGEAGKEAVLPLSELWTQMRSMINDGVNKLVSFAAPLLGMDKVSTSTVSTVTNSAVNRTVVQNVNFHNEFHGERAAQQRTASTMKQAATDTTAELARGLAFAK